MFSILIRRELSDIAFAIFEENHQVFIKYIN